MPFTKAMFISLIATYFIADFHLAFSADHLSNAQPIVLTSTLTKLNFDRPFMGNMRYIEMDTFLKRLSEEGISAVATVNEPWDGFSLDHVERILKDAQEEYAENDASFDKKPQQKLRKSNQSTEHPEDKSVIDLQGKKVDVDYVILPIISTLQFNTTVTQLGLAYNELHDRHLKPITDMLKKNTTLKILNLKGNNFTDPSFYMDTPFTNKLNFEGNITLTTLIFSGYALYLESLESVLHSLQSNTALTHLDISCTHCWPDEADEAAELLKVMPTNIKILSLAGNLISDEKMEDIADWVSAHRTLTQLNLSDNEFGDQGVNWIISKLQSNSILKKLDLSRNWIQFEMMKTFMSSIAPKLIKLNLSRNTFLNAKSKLQYLYVPNGEARKYLSEWQEKYPDVKLEYKGPGRLLGALTCPAEHEYPWYDPLYSE